MWERFGLSRAAAIAELLGARYSFSDIANTEKFRIPQWISDAQYGLFSAEWKFGFTVSLCYSIQTKI
jgi:hypothetical protein